MHEYAPGDPLVFSHIPKCAGSSLRAALIEALKPERVVTRLDLSLLGGYDDVSTLKGHATGIFVLDPDELPSDATLVAGHMSPETTMARYPHADHITTLRHPGLRIVSQWVHSRALSDFDLRHWGALGEAFRVSRRPFREYLRHEMIAPNIDNTITRFLTWPHPLLQPAQLIDESHDAELLGTAMERLDRFAHVGVVENPAFLDDLSTWLGRPLSEIRHNERHSMPRARQPDLAAEMSEDTVALLEHRTRIDRQLWAHVAQKTLATDTDEVLGAAWDKSMARYAEAMQQPDQRRPLRRTVEALYGAATRLGAGR